MQKMTAKFTDEELMAYVDGEVGEEHRRAIKAAAAADPKIARTIAMFAQTRVMARAAFSSMLQETRPRLAAAIRPASKDQASAALLGAAASGRCGHSPLRSSLQPRSVS